MRVLLQLVQRASVTVDGSIVSSIGKGFLLFVGVGEGDEETIASKMASKVSKLRIFPDENGKTNLGLKDVDGDILCVSQFTLYACAKEGNRPSFTKVMRQEEARPIYEKFVSVLKETVPVKEGIYRADMKVELVNDGPFTLILDSEELFK